MVDANSTIYIYFTTHAQTGAAVAPSSAFEAADVRLYKNGSATERTSQAGWTMTSPFDTVTGLHLLAIDLSDNTDAGFYAAGSRYTAVLVPDETVDTLSVVRVLADFTIGPVAADVEQWLGTAAATPTVAGVPEVDVTHWLGTAAATPTVAGVPEVDLTHVAGSTTSVSVLASNVATLIADIGGVATAAADGDPTSTDLLFAYIKQLINILVGTTGVVTFPAAAAPANNVSLAEIIRAIYDDTNALPDSGALTTIQSDLDNIQTRIPAALVSGKMDSVADVTAISGDTTAADNLESEYDGTGYGHILQRTTIATLASQTSFTLTAGSADNDAYNGCIIVIQDAATAAQKAVGVILDYTGASKTVTLLNDPAVFTIATTDIVTIIADRSVKPTVDNRTLDVSAGGEAGVDWANVGSPTTVVGLSGTTIKDATDVETKLGTPAGASVSADILTIDNLVDDLESRLGTPSNLGSGATVAANLVDIEGQTDDIGVAGAGLTAVPWNAAWDAEVQSEVQDALASATGTADSGSTTTMVDAARTEADTDYWKGSFIRFTSGTILGQTRLITAFDPATDTITFAPATTQAVATQTYEILPAARVDLHAWLGTVAATPTVAGVPEVDVTHVGGTAQTAGDIIGDTNDIQARLPAALVGGRMDSSVGAMAANTLTAAATAADFLAEVNAEVVDVIATDTITLPGQAAPSNTPTIREALSWLYKNFRNRKAQTATQWSLYADDEATVDSKATVSDDGTTAIKQEIVTGP